MQQIKLLAAIILIIAILGACSGNTQNADRLTPTSPNVTLMRETASALYAFPPSLDKVKEYTDIVVAGTLSDDTVCKYYDSVSFRIWYSVTTLTVTDVIEGNVSVGDKIPIMEGYSYEDTGDGKYVLRYSNMYQPSISHDEYLFFLAQQPETREWCAGLYTPVMGVFGRYPIISTKSQTISLKTMSESDLDMIYDPYAYGSVELYKEMYAEVYSEYLS